MVRRLLQLTALLVAVAVAIVAGTAVREHRAGPDPIDVAREATAAYASGNCRALREVSFDPGLIDCGDVAGVSTAYRDEGLRPSTFTYELVASDDRTASVRITYRRDGGERAEEIVRLQRRGEDWLVLATPLGSF